MTTTTLTSSQSLLKEPLVNSKLETLTLGSLMGKTGLFVGFGEDIWALSSVRRVLWLQRHAYQILHVSVNVAMVFRSDAHQLYGFQMSIPRPITFPLLVDYEGVVFDCLKIDDKGGFLAFTPDGTIARTWCNPSVMPRVSDITRALLIT